MLAESFFRSGTHFVFRTYFFGSFADGKQEIRGGFFQVFNSGTFRVISSGNCPGCIV